MGLSNEERLRGLYRNASEITKLTQKYKSDNNKYDIDDNKYLISLIDDIWPAIEGKRSNPLHWLIGSATSAGYLPEYPTSAWDLSLVMNLEEIIEEPNEILEAVNYKEFNALKNIFAIEHLLEHNEQFIFKVYQTIENLSYYLRRYDDDFLKSFDILNETISRIVGYCFAKFNSCTDFAKAYLINQIAKLVYIDEHYDLFSKEELPKKVDKVTLFLVEHNVHHSLKKYLTGLEPKDIVPIHVKLAKLAEDNSKKDSYFKERLSLVAQVCAEQEQKLFINKFKRHKFVKEAQKIFRQNGKVEKKPNHELQANKRLNCYGFRAYKFDKED